MSEKPMRHVSEQEAMAVAEASRETEWTRPSFLRELFLGNFRLDLIHPYPLDEPDRPEFAAFFAALKELLKEHGDPVEIDTTGEYPEALVDGLRRLGAFGMKIPQKYGGLGFSQREYQRVMELLGSWDGNVSALLSAHQSIGVPQPLKLFGSEELKKEYLPRCAAGEISAFALTELEVGSDPARLTTTAELTPEGDAYVLNGTKLWCTNGTIARLLVVMARDPKINKISAFVVEADWPGVKVEHRCRFMGLRALANAVISFEDVRVPRREPDRPGGQGAQDRAHHAQRRPAVDPQRLGRRRQGGPGDLPAVVLRARAVGQAGRSARGDHAQDRRHGGEYLCDGGGGAPGDLDGRPGQLRHPPRGGGGQGVEHRPHLGDRRRHDADPRRPRLRDRELRWRRAARCRSASSG